jgi:hypothetical protein
MKFLICSACYRIKNEEFKKELKIESIIER